jgi:RsiW-degrading membrane proteinase PrsW (M82 family)
MLKFCQRLFAVAWLLLLFVIVRPQNITVGPLAVVVVLGLIVETPLAIALETMSGGNTNNILAGVFEVGVPEELSKMVPVLAIATIVLFFKPKAAWLALKPQDYLFLGAVSGAVFGASEAVHYVVTQLPAIIQQDGGISIAGVQQVVYSK